MNGVLSNAISVANVKFLSLLQDFKERMKLTLETAENPLDADLERVLPGLKSAYAC